MIDTHTHPYLSQFEEGGADAVTRAIDNGVAHMVLPNVDASTIEPMMALHHRFPDHTSVAMGLHPTEVGDDWETVVDDMERLLDDGGFVAVGEVGIDLYWEKDRKVEQMQAFARQLRIASRLNLPVIIHCREALEETLQVISEVQPDVPLIFHSFTGSPDDVRRIREVCHPMFGILPMSDRYQSTNTPHEGELPDKSGGQRARLLPESAVCPIEPGKKYQVSFS